MAPPAHPDFDDYRGTEVLSPAKDRRTLKIVGEAFSYAVTSVHLNILTPCIHEFGPFQP